MLKKEEQLKRRDLYLNKLIAFKDTELVKVVTGIRRCGKIELVKINDSIFEGKWSRAGTDYPDEF